MTVGKKSEGKRTVVRGTVRKLGLEGGLWALVTESGDQWELLDAPAALKINGMKAEVTLEGGGGDATIGMVGHAGRVVSFDEL